MFHSTSMSTGKKLKVSPFLWFFFFLQKNMLWSNLNNRFSPLSLPSRGMRFENVQTLTDAISDLITDMRWAWWVFHLLLSPNSACELVNIISNVISIYFDLQIGWTKQESSVNRKAFSGLTAWIAWTGLMWYRQLSPAWSWNSRYLNSPLRLEHTQINSHIKMKVVFG